MKALSIKQPWAWLICQGWKDVENRDWPLPAAMYGQRIYIHAGLSRSEFTLETMKWVHARLTAEQGAELVRTRLAYGAIIGEVTVTGLVTSSPSPWFVGRYGFLLTDARLYDTPIPCKGQLGFFEVPR